MADDDLRQYLNDPIAAISPAIVAALPKMGILLAPYLEKGNGKEADSVTFERPPEHRYIPSSRHELGDMTMLALGIKEIEVADYHYQFYSALAAIMADRWSAGRAGALLPHHPRGAQRGSPRRSRRAELAPEAGPAAPPDQRAQRDQAVPRVCPPGIRRHPHAVSARHLLRHRRGDRSRARCPAATCAAGWSCWSRSSRRPKAMRCCRSS